MTNGVRGIGYRAIRVFWILGSLAEYTVRMTTNDGTLPVFDSANPDPEPDDACSLKNYVTNEQASIAAEMRRLRDRAEVIRTRIEAADSAREKEDLNVELVELRRCRERLVVYREKAIERKMVILGHEPPDPLL